MVSSVVIARTTDWIPPGEPSAGSPGAVVSWVSMHSPASRQARSVGVGPHCAHDDGAMPDAGGGVDGSVERPLPSPSESAVPLSGHRRPPGTGAPPDERLSHGSSLPADPRSHERARARCCARSRCPTIDHRGPEFQALGPPVLEKIKPVFGTTNPVVMYPASGHRRVGGGAGQHASARATGCCASRPGTSRRCGRRWRARSGSPSSSCRATGATASTPPWSRSGCAPTAATRSRPSASCTTRPRPASRAGSARCARRWTPRTTRRSCSSTPSPRSGRSTTATTSGSVDVTVAGSQKGLMLPPGMSFNAVSDKALDGLPRRPGCAGRSGTGTPILAANENGFWPYTPEHEPAVRPATSRSTCSTTRASRTSSPATSGTPRPPGAAVREWGLEVLCLDEREHSGSLTAVLMPEGHDADELRRIILERFDMSLGAGLTKLAGKVFRIGHLGDFNDLTLAGTLCRGADGPAQRRRPGQGQRRRRRPRGPLASPDRRLPLRRRAVSNDRRRRARRRHCRRPARAGLRRPNACCGPSSTARCSSTTTAGTCSPATRACTRSCRWAWSSRGTPTTSPPPCGWPAELGVTVTPRGAGTSLAGQTIGAGHRAGLLAAHGPHPRPRPGGADRAGAARRRAGRPQPGGRAVRPDVRAGHLDQQPGHDRRDVRQQLRRQRVAALRHDDRPRARARRRAVRRLDGTSSRRSTRPSARGAPRADTLEGRIYRRAAGRSSRRTERRHRERVPAVLAPGRRLPARPAGRRHAVRPGDVRRRLRGHARDRHRGRGRPGAQAEAHGVRRRALRHDAEGHRGDRRRAVAATRRRSS